MSRAVALLTLCWIARSMVAHADASTLVPTYAEAQQRASERAAARLEQTLRQWPDVAQARVHIAQADVSRAPLDQPLPRARVSAWLELVGPGPSEANVRQLLAAGAPGATIEPVILVKRARPPIRNGRGDLASVGPFRVAPESAPWLRALLATLLASNVGLCTILLARRARNTRAT